MDKKKIFILSGVIVAVIAIVSAILFISKTNQEKKCREYEQTLGGYSYTAYDSTKTKNHGNVSYSYNMKLNEDGTCMITFRATRTGDTGSFPKNGTTEFEITGLNWEVQRADDNYEVYISGDWDWQGWSAGEIDRTLEIFDIDGEDLFLKGARSKYYDLYFKQSKQLTS